MVLTVFITHDFQQGFLFHVFFVVSLFYKSLRLCGSEVYYNEMYFVFYELFFKILSRIMACDNLCLKQNDIHLQNVSEFVCIVMFL